MLPAVTVTCFLLSYSISLLLEVLRLIFRFPGRNLVLLSTLILGWIAHTFFLINQLHAGIVDAAQPQLLSSWFQWMILGAWGLASAYLVLLYRNLQTAIGVFLIPIVLALIVLGLMLRSGAPFEPETTAVVWRLVHGVSLLVGTMSICIGLAFGAMYLLQSYRLKSKIPAIRVFRLPTLEFLQSMNRMSLFVSVISLGLGLLSGIALNLSSPGGISWFNSGILVTFALFAWSLTAAIMELTETSSLGGRRTAYLAIANFVFLLIVLGLLFLSSHAQAPGTSSSSTKSQSEVSV